MKTNKILSIFLTSCIFISASIIPAYANDTLVTTTQSAITTNLTPINNSKENAIELDLNTKKDAVTWNWKRKTYAGLLGELWFKVYLPKGEQAITVYTSKKLTATVISYDNQEIFNGQYGSGMKISQKANIENSGMYYIKLTPENYQDPCDFYIMAGEPFYKLGSYKFSVGNYLTLNKITNKSNTASFDLSSISSIPDGALVDQITLNTGEYLSKWVNVDFYLKSNSYNSLTIPWSSNFWVSDIGKNFGVINAKQSWSIYFKTSDYSRLKSVMPTITLGYAAPDYNAAT